MVEFKSSKDKKNILFCKKNDENIKQSKDCPDYNKLIKET